MASERQVLDDGLWAVDRFWGYLLDRDGLASRFGSQLSGLSDAETFEFVLRQQGLAGVAGLTGQFAAVLRHRGDELVALVADHMGLVPLYWAKDGHRIVADADLKVLRDRVWDGHTIDSETVAAHLMHVHWYAGRRTQYPGVFRVQPGTVTLLGSDRPRAIRYFDPRNVSTRTDLSSDEGVEMMRSVLEVAVSEAAAGQAVATHLSGGLDSGVITALAQRFSPDGLRYVSSWTPAQEAGRPEVVEQRILRQSEEHLGVTADRLRYRDSISEGVGRLDPLLYPSWGYLHYEWAGLARASQAGASIVLSGWGGDDFASAPNPLMPAQFLLHGRSQLLREHLHRQSRTQERSLAVTIASAIAAPTLRKARLRVRRAPEAADVRYRGWLPEFNHLAAASRRRAPMRLSQRGRMVFYYFAGHLNARTDTWWRAAGDHGLEYRYPLLDQRVIRTALAMPAWYFNGDGLNRWGFRTLAAALLPRDVVTNRDKSEPLRYRELMADGFVARRSESAQSANDELARLTRMATANMSLRQ